jgi:hypothetical protein
MSTATKAQSFKNRIIAVLLAALMVIGMSFAMPVAFADPIDPDTPPAVGVTPTGDEYVYNPEGQYLCPQGGLFRFAGEGFVPNATIIVELKNAGVLLGSFDIDAIGNIVPAIRGEQYAAVIIPEGTAPDDDLLDFFYEDGTDFTAIPTAATILTILPSPYSADFSIDLNLTTGVRYLHVTSDVVGLWAPNQDIYFKIDYRDNPTYGPFTTNADGTFDAYWPLPSSLINTGVHTFTLLTGDASSGSVNYPRASISQNLTL